MMFSGLRSKLNKRWFNWQARGIYQTAPVSGDPASPLVVLSQLHHPDVTMYLVAVKSFCRFVRPGRFVIVDDGLTADDRALLQRHFSPLSFVSSRAVSSEDCPKGGCWERLLTISDLNASHYVIQLDADTITVRRPDEVIECIQSGVSFTLGTPGGRRIVPTAETSRIAAGWTGQHVQVVAEQAAHRLPPELGGSYVHGCAGFAGFRPGSIDRRRVEQMSAAFSALVTPQKWREWGSEQVTSNFLVANTAGAVVLSPDTYPFWQPGVDAGSARLVHFFGPHRFSGGMYVRCAREVARTIALAADSTSPTA